jgi:hypothetical protein
MAESINDLHNRQKTAALEVGGATKSAWLRRMPRRRTWVWIFENTLT